ncbi:MAG: ABC transporter substrate-binding protein [Spirochaetaceae bacterium]|nr:ABC transporter substrate-binding protein [Spirochaetaceae bacterium]
MKKAFLLLLALVLVISFIACRGNDKEKNSNNLTNSSANNEGLIVVGFSQVGAESDWRLANTKSMRETFNKENGYRLILKDAQQKLENQISAIRGFIEQKVDYIVFAPVTEEGWDDVLKEAKAAGIPVIIVDRMINTKDDSLYTCWVGSDFRKEGETAVAWMETTFKDKASLKIVHLQGSLGSSAQIGRTEGLLAGVERNSGWEVVYRASGNFTQVKGKEVMEHVLKQHNRIDVLYCENDNMAFGAMEAMEVAKKTYGVNGDIKIISFDATHAGLDATLKGKINYNVECNPLHGPRVEAIIQQLERGEKLDKLAYVEEEAFDAATITQAVIDARAY